MSIPPKPKPPVSSCFRAVSTPAAEATMSVRSGPETSPEMCRRYRSDELEHLGPVVVVDGELVRQELVDARDQAKELARLRLPLLPDLADRRAVLAGDLVLVRHLDEL